ncbi:hypothetical protein FUAX_23320 [Fulvitalea axinellae]|uniref:DUF6089 domain-containing protein n=1 Tax=Fulvitalea axinellae TaxID=1182444 RepID=A0AAU9DBY0_9BACT|nr:hypothetical protein FUAX_23320 [Fulvitalea axinellae]
MKRLLLLLFLLGFFTYDGVSQSFVRKAGSSPLEVTVGVGSSTYYGDLADDAPYNNFGSNINLGMRYRVFPHVKVGFDASLISLSGQDLYEERGLSFNSINYEFAGILQAELFDNNAKDRSSTRKSIIPYGFVGVGALMFNPTVKVDGTSYDLRDFQTNGEEYEKFAMVVPLGVGVKYEINPQFSLGIEFTYRAVFTDYLDDVSKAEYRSINSFQNLEGEEQQIAMLLAYGKQAANFITAANNGDIDKTKDFTYGGFVRGNPDNDDAYTTTAVRLTYNFAKGTYKRRPKRPGRYKPPKRRKPKRRRRR